MSGTLVLLPGTTLWHTKHGRVRVLRAGFVDLELQTEDGDIVLVPLGAISAVLRPLPKKPDRHVRRADQRSDPSAQSPRREIASPALTTDNSKLKTHLLPPPPHQLGPGDTAIHIRQGRVTIDELTPTHLVVRNRHGDTFRVSHESAPSVLLSEEALERRRKAPAPRRPQKPRVHRPKMDLDHALSDPALPFCAIDFETANRYRDSACAVGIVRVENRSVVASAARLIRPPKLFFEFTSIHGITATDVEDKPPFPAVWDELRTITQGVSFFAAHNAGFDQSVLWAASEYYGLQPPQTPFACSMRLARTIWDIRPTTLPDVCTYLDIELDHHDALSDAQACAEVFLAAHAAVGFR